MFRDALHLKDDQGQALVEFALVVPFLMLILISVMHFGRAFNYWNDETHLTAEAARFAAVNRKPDMTSGLSLQAQIKAQADAADLKGATTQVCVSFPNGTSNQGDPVKVTMTFPFSWIPLISTGVTVGSKVIVPGTGIGSTTLTSSAVMRLEAQPTTFSAGCA
jgi:Flp pilus assembly protein TadG